ncbi:hypothetical protein GOD83_06735 [Sinorhizobium medicae]|nr:hypothetical protein [Sinorhizobium medicae]MDX0578238.1 hypothetical protein [Sinorhizobium medicae]MDX0780050.1 hypothetical protein [Sinorhizobium medicae]
MTFPRRPSKDSSSHPHRPDAVRRLESALGNAGATVFLARTAAETIETITRHQAHLVVVDLDAFDGEQAIFAAFPREAAASATARPFRMRG